MYQAGHRVTDNAHHPSHRTCFVAFYKTCKVHGLDSFKKELFLV